LKIDTLEIRHVEMPLREVWSISVADRLSIETVLLRVTSGEHVAWAETTPGGLPHYSADWAGATFGLLCKVGPSILGSDTGTADDLNRRLAQFRGNPFARAGIDAAWWHLEAIHQAKPLHRALGATRDFATVGADFGILDRIEDLLDRIHEAVDVGYTRVKLKVRRDWCLDVLSAVRAEFPSLVTQVDCNGAFTRADAAIFEAMDDFGLAMIEQPLPYDDLVDHARLQERISTPICLDESIASPNHLEQAIALGSCRAVNIKPGRVGGLTIAKSMIERSRDAQLTPWIGGMLESAIGAATCLALACLDGVDSPSDIFPTERFYTRDLAQPTLRFSTEPGLGRVAFADPQPGLQQHPDPELLDSLTLESATYDLSKPV
jgi:O-succinylbenzoate synthase